MAQSNPLVTVLVPTKNSARFLKLCLESIKKQSYKNIEIILIDNFSKDETLNIAREYTPFVFQKGPERTAQLNFGAKKARGKYLYRVDSDFVVDNDHVKNMVEKCEKENLDAIATFNRSDPTVSFWSKVRNLERETYKNDDLILASRFFTKRVFQKAGGFNETIVAGEDYDLHNRLLKIGCRMGKVETAETHLGEPASLWQIAKESYYYGRTFFRYLKLNPGRGLKQSFPLRFTYLKHWRSFAKNPLLTFGFILMKTTMVIFASLGLIRSKISSYSFLLFLIALLGLVARIFFLNSKPILFDEADALAYISTDPLSIVKGTMADAWPPFYFLLLKLWSLNNANLVWARSFSLLCGVINIFLVGLITKRYFNPKISLVSTFFISISPALIFDSTSARMYALTQTQSLLIIYFFLLTFQKSGRLNPLFLSLALFLGFMTHYFMLLLLLPLNLVFLLFRKRNSLNIFAWVIVQVASLLPFLVFVVLLFHPAVVMPINSLLKIPGVFVSFTVHWQGWLMSSFYPFGKSLSESLLTYIPALFYFILFLLSLKMVKKFPTPVVLLLSLVILPIVAVGFVSFFIAPIFGVTSFSIFIPYYFVLVVLGVFTFKQKRLRFLLFFLMFVSNSLILFNQFKEFSLLKEKMFESIKFLSQNIKKGDVVAHTHVTTLLPFRFQANIPNQYLVAPSYFSPLSNKAIGAESTPVETLEKTNARLWYLVLSKTSPEQEERVKRQQLELDSKYPKKEQGSFYWYGTLLKIYLYELKP
ncbi:MAG: glycosyltransferase [bacterium]|nr:glycosyltransferase [bacterium]